VGEVALLLLGGQVGEGDFVVFGLHGGFPFWFGFSGAM